MLPNYKPPTLSNVMQDILSKTAPCPACQAELQTEFSELLGHFRPKFFVTFRCPGESCKRHTTLEVSCVEDDGFINPNNLPGRVAEIVQAWNNYCDNPRNNFEITFERKV